MELILQRAENEKEVPVVPFPLDVCVNTAVHGECPAYFQEETYSERVSYRIVFGKLE